MFGIILVVTHAAQRPCAGRRQSNLMRDRHLRVPKGSRLHICVEFGRGVTEIVIKDL